MNKPTAKHYYDWIELEDWLKTTPVVKEIAEQHIDWDYGLAHYIWPDANNDSMVYFPDVEELMDNDEIPGYVIDILLLLRECFPDINEIHYWW